MFTRYAIYFTPAPQSDLAAFGSAWLGWDSATGQTVDHPSAPGLDVAGITARPRKYGFHGTIKPPFHLAEGASYDGLEAAVRALCASAAPVTIEAGLELAHLGRFIALVPGDDASALAQLAARFVQELDGFRAPPSEAELARRQAAGLNPAQLANLNAWGYPHVLDQFRFHLTLTGRLAHEEGETAEQGLRPLISQLPLRPFEIDAMTLLGSDAEGRFHQLHRVPLSG